jgi:hypothetical protein
MLKPFLSTLYLMCKTSFEIITLKALMKINMPRTHFFF